MDTTVADYVSEIGKLSPEAFMAAYPFPVLLHRPIGLDSGSNEEATVVSARKPTGPTFATQLEEERTFAPVFGEDDRALIVRAIKKRPGNPYEDTVTLGRAANNDIVFNARRISKLHAYFTWSADRTEHLLTDASSTNLSFVRGRPIAAKSPTALAEDQLDLCFGGIPCVYFRPAAFEAWLRALPKGPTSP